MAKVISSNVSTESKYPYPNLPEDASKEAKAEVLRVRAQSTRDAQRDVISAVVTMDESATLGTVRTAVAEALAYLAERANGRKGVAGEGVARAPKSNVVADYFKGKNVGDKVDASDVFFDLDMDPARVQSALKRFVSTVKNHDERVWISYDRASRSYVVAGYGATKPRDFSAYDVENDAADLA